MKKVFVLMASVAITLVSCKKAEDKEITTTTTTTTTTTPLVDTTATEASEAEKPMDSAAMMKAWQEYATPGDVHKALAADVGKWNCEMTFWQGPGAEPEKAKSTAEVKMTFGGRYQEAYYKGDMMGMPFEGKATVGYNNASGKAFSTFYDNMGTGFMYSEGTYEPARKTFFFEGEMTDPTTKKDAPFREEYLIVDANTRKMSMFDKKNGTEYKSMEIIMTRAK